MRIAYFVHLNYGADSGVFKKIVSQVMSWAETGCEVRLFVVTRHQAMADALRQSEIAGQAECVLYANTGRRSALDRIRAMSAMMRRIRQWHPNVLYTRQDMWYPPVWLTTLRVPTVFEVNGHDLTHLRRHSTLQYIYHLCTRWLSLLAARGCVYVTQEIAASPAFRRYRKPSLVIANGIRMAGVTPLSVPSPANEYPRLGFLGQAGQPWHGVDRILQMARLFPEWRFDLIGMTAEQAGESLPANVTCWGALLPSRYRPILEQCDCAIGSMAMYRAGCWEGCPLKTREYAALGLPVILGYSDTDFPQGADFILELPNTAENVDANVAAIRDFVGRWQGRRVPRSQVAHLDTKVKEHQRLDFMKSVAGCERRSVGRFRTAEEGE